MAKQLKYGAQAKQLIMSGISQLAEAVKVTLGPRGENVIIQKKFGPPTITKDGVSVAKEIELEDPFENMGAQMVKEVASKTSDDAGDGTTTATILAEAIYREGLKNVTAGANPTAIKRGIDKAAKVVIEHIEKVAKSIKGNEEIAQIATIASNGDKEIGDLIAQAIEKVGKDGVITVEESKSVETYLEIVEGMQFDNGYLSPHFITDPKRMETVLEDALILLYEENITSIKDFLPLLEKVARAGKPFLVISDNVSNDVLATLVINKMKGTLRCCAVKPPGYGQKRKAMLEDLAILTGGKAITKDLGLKLEMATIEDLGKAKKVVINKDETIILEGLGAEDELKERIEQLKKQIEDSASDYDKEQLQERLAKLSGGIAVINVGAATESEVREEKDRIEDALHATRAAVDEGIVPGGGVVLLRCIPVLQDTVFGFADIGIGKQIVMKALEEPIKQIICNAGISGDVIIDKLKNEQDLNKGYDVTQGQIVDMFASGVIDPAKVTKTAVQNSAGIAGLLLMTKVMIADIEEEKPEVSSIGTGHLPPGSKRIA